MKVTIRSVALGCLLTAGGIALAAGPESSRPATATTEQSPTTMTAGSGMAEDPNRPHPQNQRGGPGRFRGKPTEDPHWTDALKFMQTNSPLRTAAVVALPAESLSKPRLQEMILWDYETTIHLKTDTDHELYDTVVDRIQIEDTIFGLATDYENAPAGQKAGFKTKLHDQIEKAVEINLKERQLRLDRLRKTVDEEQAKLVKDKSEKQKLVETRVDSVLQGDLQPFGARGPHGGGGGPGGGGRNRPGPEETPAAEQPK